MRKGIPIRSISRSLAVLQAVNRSGALLMNDIAEASDIPYPTACRIVQTLVHEGMLERDQNRRRYRVTALVQSLSLGFEDSSRLAAVAGPHAIALTRQILWPVIVASRVGESMVVRDSTTHMTSLSYRDYRVGHTMSLLFSTSGRAYLAFCEPEERNIILEGLKVSQPSSAPHIDSPDFTRDMDNIRAHGFVVQKYNHAAPSAGKIASLSAPILNNGKCDGALTMIFFATAMSTQDAIARYARPVIEAAAEIGGELGAGGMTARC